MTSLREQKKQKKRKERWSYSCLWGLVWSEPILPVLAALLPSMSNIHIIIIIRMTSNCKGRFGLIWDLLDNQKNDGWALSSRSDNGKHKLHISHNWIIIPARHDFLIFIPPLEERQRGGFQCSSPPLPPVICISDDCYCHQEVLCELFKSGTLFFHERWYVRRVAACSELLSCVRGSGESVAERFHVEPGRWNLQPELWGTPKTLCHRDLLGYYFLIFRNRWEIKLGLFFSKNIN